MIRFLQRDSRVVKAFFVVIIGVASVSMVVYLIPGLTGQGAASADTYAVIYPHWYSTLLSSGVDREPGDGGQDGAGAVAAAAAYPDNPVILELFEQQVGQQLVQQQILLAEAEKLGIHATDDDVRQYLQTGPAGQVLFPNGKFIGDDQYASLVANRFNMSVAEFEDDVQARHRHPPAAGADHGRRHGERPGSPRRLSQEQHQDQVRLRGDLLGRSAQDDQSLGQRSGSVLQEERRALRHGGAGRAQDHLLCLYAQRAARRRAAAHAAGDSGLLQRPPDRVPGAGAGRARGTSSSRWTRARTPRPMRRPRPRRREF